MRFNFVVKTVIFLGLAVVLGGSSGCPTPSGPTKSGNSGSGSSNSSRGNGCAPGNGVCSYGNGAVKYCAPYGTKCCGKSYNACPSSQFIFATAFNCRAPGASNLDWGCYPKNEFFNYASGNIANCLDTKSYACTGTPR